MAGDACWSKVKFCVACMCVCVCARADDGLLGFWIFNAGALSSVTGPFEHLFANARGYVLTGASLLLPLLC